MTTSNSAVSYFSFIMILGLRILVACGPYTTIDSLCYEPLSDFIAVLQRDVPDVCIMVSEICIVIRNFISLFFFTNRSCFFLQILNLES